MTLLDFDVESAKIAGRDFLDLQKKGQMIDIEDILIGATSKRNQLRVASTNTRHYSRITGLQLVDLTGL
jgi:predicted nucleic acid-binding protein